MMDMHFTSEFYYDGGPWDSEATDEAGRLRAGLERIQRWASRDSWRPDREWPSDLAERWHDGHTAASAHVALLCMEVLDPEGWEAHERRSEIAGRGTDAEWFAETGHCGGCGRVADCCDCRGRCGCWDDHGPPPEPYESPVDRACRQRDEAVRVLARLVHTDPSLEDWALRCDAAQGVLFAWDSPARCGECPPCHVAVMLGDVLAV